jgi:hypothetical protein
MSSRSASRSQRSVPTAQSAMPSERRHPHAKAIESTGVAQPFRQDRVRQRLHELLGPGTVASVADAMCVAGMAEYVVHPQPGASAVIAARGPIAAQTSGTYRQGGAKALSSCPARYVPFSGTSCRS